MKKTSKVGKRISRLRIARGETQVEFAKKLEVSQAIVSSWERDKDRPSPESWFALGSLAPDAERNWFWQRAGDYLKAVLKATKTIRRECRTPLREGEAIRVPYIRKTAQGREDVEGLVPLPTEFLPDPDSTFCLIFDEDATTRILPAEGLIVLDRSENTAEDLSPFWDEIALVQFDTRKERGGIEMAWPEGLAMGRLRCKAQPYPDSYMDWIAEFVPLNYHLPSGTRGLNLGYWHYQFSAAQRKALASPFGLVHDERKTKRTAEAQARKELRLSPDCRILGRVIGWFRLSGEGKQRKKGRIL
jgi:DNA-binding XRE family transcriptional regulator